ncbi:hypothetical protein HMPREF0281_01482 [Corynebacterium ammoniagenes DSM 20306]|uniref:Uncharacterized protein n=1 Tax=Corynebacterium ammoniagenes DSM 20306 TaxID=649754 RepID=A0ABN0AEU0_CORAM|nr:hypothetical protein HMPREF0281_01482 [Corynebacterium ammoniagenes DSM 20306]
MQVNEEREDENSELKRLRPLRSTKRCSSLKSNSEKNVWG